MEREVHMAKEEKKKRLGIVITGDGVYCDRLAGCFIRLGSGEKVDG